MPDDLLTPRKIREAKEKARQEKHITSVSSFTTVDPPNWDDVAILEAQLAKDDKRWIKALSQRLYEEG